MTSAYTTPALVQAELRLTSEFSADTYPSDDTVNTWIAEASKQIEQMSNEVFSRTVVSSEYHDFSGITTIFNFPVANLLSVDKVEYNINSDTMVPSYVELIEGPDYDYMVYLNYGEIIFTKGVNATVKEFPKKGYKKFRMSYKYGYNTTPFDIEHLCTLMVAKRVIQSLVNYQANTKMGEVTVGPVKIADPSNFSIGYIKTIDNDIKQLREDMGVGYKTFKFTRLYDEGLPYGRY